MKGTYINEYRFFHHKNEFSVSIDGSLNLEISALSSRQSSSSAQHSSIVSGKCELLAIVLILIGESSSIFVSLIDLKSIAGGPHKMDIESLSYDEESLKSLSSRKLPFFKMLGDFL